MKLSQKAVGLVLIPFFVGLQINEVKASSHMDAPLITLDDAANTTDVYAFVSESAGIKYLTTGVAVYPFEEPGIGPNYFHFDDNVLYEIHVALDDDVPRGQKTISYQFKFNTTVRNPDTIATFNGVVLDVGDTNQNVLQTYTVTKVDHRTRTETDLSEGQTPMVPPNNQGRLTPSYNALTPNPIPGENPPLSGATTFAELDKYTRQAIFNFSDGYQYFAGQREDGFYGDIQSIFDLDFLFEGPNKPFDSQGGFNVHTIVLNIPMAELGGASNAGVYATTSRQKRTSLSMRPETKEDRIAGSFVQVGRQGNPLFTEALVALKDKNLYNRTDPTEDDRLFRQYAMNPELARLIGLTMGNDLSSIYSPDLIKVALDTDPARLPGQTGFNRLSIYGGDVLSRSSGGTVPGGWPNGRRFGDDVVDIAFLAIVDGIISVPTPINIDKVPANDQIFHQVFPYAGTPWNGRNHPHH